MTELRYMNLAGSPRAMGESHGEAYRDDIRDFVERRIGHLLEFVRKYDPDRNISRREALRAAESVVETHEAYDDALWEEFLGIATGAGVAASELLVCNGLTDVRDLVLMSGLRNESNGAAEATSAPAGDSGECTSFGASAEASGSTPLLGQTWDMHPDAIDFLLVARREPEGFPATLSLTTVGCLSLTGVNSEGVAVCTSNLVPTDVREGVSYLFTITKALQAAEASEAADIIEGTARLSGHHFMVSDRSSVLDLETTATRFVRTRHDSGVRVHANHYLDPTLRELAFDRLDISSSLWRQDHLEQAFAEAGRPVSVELCWEQLSDSTRGDGAVCNEDYDGRHGDVATAATVVIDPGERTLTACAGGARLGRRCVFTL